jgi:hypothetical protein
VEAVFCAMDQDDDCGGGRSRKWTPSEDEALREAVERHGGRGWRVIAAELPGRTDIQCQHRWQKVLRPGLRKGAWTKEEDETMLALVKKYGTKKMESNSQGAWRTAGKTMSGALFQSLGPFH